MFPAIRLTLHRIAIAFTRRQAGRHLSPVLLATMLGLLATAGLSVRAQAPAKPAAPAANATAAGADWISTVVLPAARALDQKTLDAELRKHLRPEDRYEGLVREKNVLAIKLGTGRAFVSLIDTPIPNNELQQTCRFAWYWPQACDAVRNHRAHYLAVLAGTGLPKLDAALLQTRITAALLGQGQAIAAYWGTSLQSREDFLAASENISRQNLPTTLWIAFRLAREAENRFSLSTQGLRDFGLMEMEARDAPLPGNELFDLALGAVTHLLVRGPFINDGDTIGPSPDKRAVVRHADSYWNAGTRVYRLQFAP